MTDPKKSLRWPAKLAGDRFIRFPDEYLPLCEKGIVTRLGERAVIFRYEQFSLFLDAAERMECSSACLLGPCSSIAPPNDLARALARYFGPDDPEDLPFWRAKVRFEEKELYTEVWVCETQRLEKI